jgi:hypothetical protein
MNEAYRLLALLETCQKSLDGVEGRRFTRNEKKIVSAIHDTCRDIEMRLAELGVPFADRTTKHFEESRVLEASGASPQSHRLSAGQSASRSTGIHSRV